MPQRVRRLLYRAVDFLADSRHAARQAAGVPCVQLMDDFRCAIFGQPERPAVCRGLRPSASMCGEHRDAALTGLAALERMTRPG